MKIDNEKEQLSKEKHLRRKGTSESGMELNPVFKEINGLRNGRTSGQDLTQLSFQLVRKN